MREALSKITRGSSRIGPNPQTMKLKTILKHFFPYIVIVLFAVAIISPVISNHAYIGGLDSYFHMNSFYEDAMQIKHNQYSYFLSIFGFDQSARVVNAVYAPGFNYVMGELLLLCGSWMSFNIISTLLVLSISGVGMYLLSRDINMNKTYAIVIAMLYMMTHPIMSWVGNQEFTGIGAMILPFAFLVGIKMIQNRQIRILPLVILMSIVLQTHLVTSLITCLILLPYAFWGLVRSSQKIQFVKNGLWAVLITFFLNGNIFGTLYDLFTTNNLIPTFPQFTTQASGVKFQHLSITNVGLMFTVIFMIAAIVLLISISKFNSVNYITLLVGLFFLWLSSSYFPWSNLEKRWINIANTVQFPQRFMSAFWIPALLTVGSVLTMITNQNGIEHLFGRYTSYIILVILLIMNFGMTLNYTGWLPKAWNQSKVVRYMDSDIYYSHNPNKIRADFESSDLTKGLQVIKKQTPDYLPTNHQINLKKYYNLPIYTEMQNQLQDSNFRCKKHATSHGLIITWQSIRDKNVTIPAVAYAHSLVTLNGIPIHPKKSFVGAMRVHEQIGKNKLTIHYHPGVVFKMLITIMIFMWIIVISIGIKKILRQKGLLR